MTIISMLNLNGFVAVPEEGDLLSAPTWMIPGTQSNFLGESVKVVLQRDPRSTVTELTAFVHMDGCDAKT